MKTLGVIGGIGPQATMEFERLVHHEARERIPPRANGGYPPLLVYYHRAAPFRVDARGARLEPVQADPALLEAAEWLGRSADFLVITANMAHLVRDQIERAAGREVLSMIDVALDEVRHRGWKRIGVLGMGEPVVYLEPLAKLGIDCATLEAEPRGLLDAAILRLMEGREDDEARMRAREAVAGLRGRRVDGVLLGCTEIPLLLGDDARASDLLNPLEYLAKAAVRRAIS